MSALILSLLLSVSFASAGRTWPGQTFDKVMPLSKVCLHCLCHAMSQCNDRLACRQDACGRFRISRTYWLEAQEVVPGDLPGSPRAFENCAEDHDCSERTVRKYLTTFTRDCNNDGIVSCIDYAMTHKLGAYGCPGNVEPNFFTMFNLCILDSRNRIRSPGEVGIY